MVHRPYDRTNLETNIASQRIVTDLFTARLEDLAPEGGAYLNEADINQSNWQFHFHGENYHRLLAIKKKYDAAGIFWGPTAVGSEPWAVDSDGRLCKIGSG